MRVLNIPTSNLEPCLTEELRTILRTGYSLVIENSESEHKAEMRDCIDDLEGLGEDIREMVIRDYRPWLEWLFRKAESLRLPGSANTTSAEVTRRVSGQARRDRHTQQQLNTTHVSSNLLVYNVIRYN
jgi:hypothetical protein